jgi:phytoene dehydrogenase-like protein
LTLEVAAFDDAVGVKATTIVNVATSAASRRVPRDHAFGQTCCSIESPSFSRSREPAASYRSTRSYSVVDEHHRPCRRRSRPGYATRAPGVQLRADVGCAGGDFTHAPLQPELMGPFRPGPCGWRDNPIPFDGLYLCGAGCHDGPGVTFIPGYDAGHEVLDALG